MSSDLRLHAWFCDELLPLESALTGYIRRNWRIPDEVVDLRQEVYERALKGAQREIPGNTRGYVFMIARNLLINRARRARIVSFEQVADMDSVENLVDLRATDRMLDARDALRRAQVAFDALPQRCREVVRLRKVEGLSTIEAAERMGVGVDTIERQLVLGMRAIADFMLGGDGKIRRPKRLPAIRSGRR